MGEQALHVVQRFATLLVPSSGGDRKKEHFSKHCRLEKLSN